MSWLLEDDTPYDITIPKTPQWMNPNLGFKKENIKQKQNKQIWTKSWTRRSKKDLPKSEGIWTAPNAFAGMKKWGQHLNHSAHKNMQRSVLDESVEVVVTNSQNPIFLNNKQISYRNNIMLQIPKKKMNLSWKPISRDMFIYWTKKKQINNKKENYKITSVFSQVFVQRPFQHH